MQPKPLSDMVLVQMEPPLTGSGKHARPRTQQGVVLDVGPGVRSDGHSVVRMAVSRGDHVYFSEDCGVVLDDSQPVLLLISERELLAVARSEKVDEVPLFVPRPPRAAE